MLSNKKKDSPSAPNGSINVIGSDTVIEGNITSNGDVRIDGTLVGSVKTSSKLVLGISGKLKEMQMPSQPILAGRLPVT